MMKSTTEPNLRVIIAVILLTMLGTCIVAYGVSEAINYNTTQTAKNTNDVKVIKTAASLALEQASHDHAFIYAICYRFNTDEGLSEKQTRDLANIEMKFSNLHGIQNESNYHLERARILQATDKVRKNRIAIECNKAMRFRIKTAPTLEP
jgi:hypothetical protein